MAARSSGLALVLVALAATTLAAQRSYSIERFDARIRVNRDASIDVTETITARFNGSYNGLFRTIPVEYRSARGLNWTLGVSLESAQDDAGHSLRTETSRQSHYIKYKIWIPGTADATRTIVLRYRATNGLRFFDEHDELYWNVTGDEWEVPIEAATAEIELPPQTPGVRAIAYNGVYGATAQDASVTVDSSIVRVTMPHSLSYHEGLTGVVALRVSPSMSIVIPPIGVPVLSTTVPTDGSMWRFVLEINCGLPSTYRRHLWGCPHRMWIHSILALRTHAGARRRRPLR